MVCNIRSHESFLFCINLHSLLACPATALPPAHMLLFFMA